MAKTVDLTGMRFGRLLVLGGRRIVKEKSGHTHSVWKCKCDCGNIVEERLTTLRSGKVFSCGCYKKEYLHNKLYKGHDKYLYGIRRQMIERCYDKDSQYYYNYGGRGITVCDEWLTEGGQYAFQEWAYTSGYHRGLTIDRIDNNGQYSPSNCRWVTMKEQSNNKRNNVYITLNGKTKTLAQWCDEYGAEYSRTRYRITHGWSVMDALTLKAGEGGHNGERVQNRSKE